MLATHLRLETQLTLLHIDVQRSLQQLHGVVTPLGVGVDAAKAKHYTELVWRELQAVLEQNPARLDVSAPPLCL